jgi:hypothetical protein
MMARCSLILLWILLLNAVLSLHVAQNLTEVDTTTEDAKNNTDHDQSSWWHKTLSIFKTGFVVIGLPLEKNVTEVETATEDAKNNIDDQSRWYNMALRILKTGGVAIGVALVATLLAPVIVYIVLWCIGFTFCGNINQTIYKTTTISITFY